MAQHDLTASGRICERIYTIWEEAGNDQTLAYNLWHRLRPMLPHSGKAKLPLKPGEVLAGAS